MPRVDVAVDLVEIYLRVNGYLTLSEWQVLALNDRGQWDTVTDIDIVGVRFPGESYLAASDDPVIRDTLRVAGDLLLLDNARFDVIIGEVKQGEAVFNPSLSRPEAIRGIMSRLSHLYPGPILEGVVADLAAKGSCVTQGPGAEVRTRIVAFGQAEAAGPNVIPIADVIERAVGFIAEREDVIRSVRVANPAAAMLKLLQKSGFDVSRGSSASPGS